MANCSYCNGKIDGLGWKCSRCGGKHCDAHRLPEDHDCAVQKRLSAEGRDRFKRNMEDIATNYVARDDRGVLTLDERTHPVRSRAEAHHSKDHSSEHRNKRKQQKKQEKAERRKQKHEKILAKQHRAASHESSSKHDSSSQKSTKKEHEDGGRASKSNSLSSAFSIRKYLPAIITVLILLLLFFTFIFLTQPRPDYVLTQNQTVQDQTSRSYTEQVALPISIEDFTRNLQEKIGTKEEFIAYLRHRVTGSTSGVHVYEAIDDYGNIIALTNLGEDQRTLFDKNARTKGVFAISGTYKRSLASIDFAVTSIIPAEKTYVDIEKTANETVPRIVQNNITIADNRTRLERLRALILPDCEDNTRSGSCSEIKPLYCSRGELVENPKNCGCPEGFRLYNDACIAIITCSDGTLSPECSENQPQRCNEGTLVNDADVCGCPDDYRQKGNSCEKILRCSDGTEYGLCAKEKPLKCVKGELIEKASDCGCPWSKKLWEESCLEKEKVEALEAFEYINSLRQMNGRAKITWDERAYSLAVDRSKDMYTRDYFDHVTPEGTCAKDMKLDYGFSRSDILAENAGGMTHYDDGSPISSTDVTEAVDGWMGSRGHRYNLLAADHKSGAVGCYKYICVFFGVHQNPYGLGAGPCTTGAEGLAYWEDAPKQIGEV